jgi:L-glutamine-phosphate cytidylyltransferase
MIRALILAAGQGTRLEHLVNDKPKALVELLGKSLLDRQVGVLNSANVTDIHIVAGYHAQKIQKLGFNCSINPNFASSNMVTSLFCALPFMKQTGDLIISYGDIIYQLENLEKVIDSDADISIMVDKGWRQYWELRFNDPLTDAESLILNDDNNIMQLGKKTQIYSDIQGQYTGLIKIRSNKVEEFIDFYKQLDRQKTYDGKSFDNMYMTSFLQSLIDAKWKVQAVNVNHGWLEVDTVSDLELYEKLAKENKLNVYCKLS